MNGAPEPAYPVKPETYYLFRFVEAAICGNGFQVTARFPVQSYGMDGERSPIRFWGKCRLVFTTAGEMMEWMSRYWEATPRELDAMADLYYRVGVSQDDPS